MKLRFAVSEVDQAQIGEEALAKICAAYTNLEPDSSFEIELFLVSKDEMQELNREQRGLDEPTDVLSFPLHQNLERLDPKKDWLLGSIVICPEKAKVYQESLPELVHHGLLHLRGFDHETDLEEWQKEEGRVLGLIAEQGLILPPIP